MPRGGTNETSGEPAKKNTKNAKKRGSWPQKNLQKSKRGKSEDKEKRELVMKKTRGRKDLQFNTGEKSTLRLQKPTSALPYHAKRIFQGGLDEKMNCWEILPRVNLTRKGIGPRARHKKNTQQGGKRGGDPTDKKG